MNTNDDINRLVGRLLDDTRFGRLRWTHAGVCTGGPGPAMWEQTWMLECAPFTLYVHRINTQTHLLSAARDGLSYIVCHSDDLENPYVMRALYDYAADSAGDGNALAREILEIIEGGERGA